MRLEAVLEAGIACFLDHVGQILRDLLLGVIDILQRMHEEVVQRFNVLGEKAHYVLLSGVCTANSRYGVAFLKPHSAIISWARMTISSWESSRSSRSRRLRQYSKGPRGHRDIVPLGLVAAAP
jgi:hypothetical protein